MMKIKAFILMVVAFFFYATSNAQLSLNSSGNVYVGNCTPFSNAPKNNSSSNRITGGIIGGGILSNVMEGKFNLDGLLSISASDDAYMVFAVSVPTMVSYHSSVMPFFTINRNQEVYSKNGIMQSSDSTLKQGISPLPSTLDKIKALKGVTFTYKDTPSDSVAVHSAFGMNGQMEDESQRKRIGLIAQDVEQVYPEVVRTLMDGSKGIYYSDLVAVLVEGVKELEDSLSSMTQRYDAVQSQVDILQKQIIALQASVYSNRENDRQNVAEQESTNTSSTMHNEAMLYQNTPNPFNNATEIAYRLSSDAHKAFISIYDLTGKELKQYSLQTNVITGKLQITSSDFQPGMYVYALVIDGTMIDSKRMILSR